MLALWGCSNQQKIQHVPVTTTALSTSRTAPVVPPSPPILKVETSIRVPPPIEYTTWLNQGNHRVLVDSYKAFLRREQANFIVPDHQMFRSARDWQQCNYAQYEVPPQEVWATAVPTLKLLAYLYKQGVIPEVEVTSSYRSPFLNACAGGAKSSSHVKNSAIDFRIGAEQPSPQDYIQIQKTKLALCRFWQQQGQVFNMGLGIYESGQIHIDTLGYRTWGYDHSWRTSLCGEII